MSVDFTVKFGVDQSTCTILTWNILSGHFTCFNSDRGLLNSPLLKLKLDVKLQSSMCKVDTDSVSSPMLTTVKLDVKQTFEGDQWKNPRNHQH